MNGALIRIKSADYWVKVVEMLQQNWALVDGELGGSARVYFVHDGGGVFDEMDFPSVTVAQEALARNRFQRWAEVGDKLGAVMSPPSQPFHRSVHPSGPIYSSGRFWRT